MLLPCELQIKVKGMLNPNGAQSTQISHVDKSAASLAFTLVRIRLQPFLMQRPETPGGWLRRAWIPETQRIRTLTLPHFKTL